MPNIVKDAEGFSAITAELLRLGNTVRFRASGTSMRPFIRDGDMLTVMPTRTDSLRTGDVIFYGTPADGVMAHRVVAIRNKGENRTFLVRGDATGGPFENVSAHRILGQVTGIHRGTRWIHIGAAHHRMVPVAWAHIQTLRRQARIGAGKIKRRVLNALGTGK